MEKEAMIDGLKEALEQADQKVQVTPEVLEALPNIMKMIVSGQLVYRGWATALYCGKRTFYYV
jgi:hypothetical protein